MPKKNASARGAAQRNKPKVQKNIELVRPTTVSDEAALHTTGESAEVEPTSVATSVDTLAAPTAKSSATVRKRSTAKISESSLATPSTIKEEEPTEEPAGAAVTAASTTTQAPKSAAARLAARRQANQKSTRAAITLITAEHYSYVRRDLAFIAILASIMFAVIIILHFVPGIGS